MDKTMRPFWIMVQKEISEHIRSWRFVILLGLVLLTTSGSIYTVLSVIQDNPAKLSADSTFLYLKLFTESTSNLPPFITLIGFLGPLVGIALGFDAVNSERDKGTLSRIISQPIPRDYFINSKFVGALALIFALVFSLGLLILGLGIIFIGLPPAFGEFIRILVFLLFTCVYIAFWLNLGITFSILFRQSSTSALSVLSIWLFFSVFFSMLVRFIANALTYYPSSAQQLSVMFSRVSPNFLFNELTTILLTPSIRSLGALSFEQVTGTIPSTLPLGQSMLLVWPNITALVAATLFCFGVSYVLFMRQEIRA
ncbi:ABC transporter permease [Aliifodinibius sp. S!AR15-10]|uniref:ABC transporter permease n=1 Tax=Aliifodinibius sp. S!AR15-10 TaxID=2950437 RepID=UPI00285C85D8|nr:ABC transporter permease subunit [Aliifodinibius sp. S!AR15-10]MDR8393595.1 ABC transporter permease [Aliifodinibius sp. S!AR15-10]